jgi:phosphoribosyl 1,2-cyclic phosphodiesterase
MAEPAEVLKLKFWGVRGSVPTPLSSHLRFGGNTSCSALAVDRDTHIILDCGTGIRDLGESLTEQHARPRRFHIFFSHYHLDHVEGLPFFSPLYDKTSTIIFYGFETPEGSIRTVLQTLIAPPYFPVPLGEVPSRIEYRTLDATPVQIGPVRVDSLPLTHPNGSMSYRLERAGRSIVYATDHEHGVEATDTALIRFAKDVDYLIYDAMYVPSEYELLRRGWGHSTWYEAVHVARESGARTLILFHHHPGHTDAQLDSVLAVARQELPSVEIAREGMELPL